MKLQLLSDLHLEANPEYAAEPAMGADILVLAGDIGSYQRRRDGTVMAEPDWGLQRFSPRPAYAGWPVPVVFVPGNHEYDGQDFDLVHQTLRATCDRLGIHWLEREVMTLGDVRLVGTTLWADFDALANQPESLHKAATSGRARAQPIARASVDPVAHRLRQREKAFRAANFYLSKMAGQRAGALFDAAAMRELGLECQAWLRDALAQPFDGRTVVITHFAPTLHSADPRYGLSPGTAGFCNALDALLPQVDTWLHGHLHCPQDQRVGRCRIVANPLGYASKNEQAAFQPAALIEV
jgi:predicted phosphodiesterase